jgi:branched-subunit amino acid aminotransferase/4-amino-4-deoxychorismate lyase
MDRVFLFLLLNLIASINRRQRRQYEALEAQYENCNEVLMLKQDGHCIEGLSSNFGVLMETEDGTVMITASTKFVLDGTTMRAIKEDCRKLGIVVNDEDEGPNINDFDKWKAAFICSTSRLLLPVTLIYFNGQEKRIDSLASEGLRHLRRTVHDHLLHNY